MSLRLSLRTVVLAAVAAGAVCVPATSAFADSSPTPSPARPTQSARPSDAPSTAPSVVPSAVPSEAPRGGVAAGERPAGTSGDNTAAVTGSAVAALLVAGAGTVVLRRRSTGRRDG
ncbi:hypothetical protein [Streptomyces brevispora]|uniref:Putative secreted protein with PEP-CTERM sorting signal n=1 Tax=Streptomyces brevispora TaxID=887462 RepID=A0A561V5T5_9ACTN|nr:hypothetical protein [Streptomyces brevispora]TWG06954.1 putative secreted protein with PEP-CTERM sorting signal [Streptomyces brevispora]WSC12189.1 hypothetical protein OIE64_04570 [Streptomyces brevispora]